MHRTWLGAALATLLLLPAAAAQANSLFQRCAAGREQAIGVLR